MATEPNVRQLEDQSIPKITLAGKQWPVRKLALQQIVEVTPILVARADELNALITGGSSAVAALSRGLLHDVASIVFWGLKRGHPGLTRDEFDAMEIDLAELLRAAIVVSTQANGMSARPAKPDPLVESPAPSPEAVGAG